MITDLLHHPTYIQHRYVEVIRKNRLNINKRFQQEQATLLAECSFEPDLKLSQAVVPGPTATFLQRQDEYQVRAKQKQTRIKMQQKSQEIANFTFQPKLNQRSLQMARNPERQTEREQQNV